MTSYNKRELVAAAVLSAPASADARAGVDAGSAGHPARHIHIHNSLQSVGDPAGPLQQNPSSASVGAEPTCSRITTRPSLRATCTATPPEAVRTFRTYDTARTYPL